MARNEEATANVKMARQEISEAEVELQNLIRALQALPRAQKVTASKVVHQAFEKLRSANERLEGIEKLLKKS